jgi:hypothetical protein
MLNTLSDSLNIGDLVYLWYKPEMCYQKTVVTKVTKTFVQVEACTIRFDRQTGKPPKYHEKYGIIASQISQDFLDIIEKKECAEKFAALASHEEISPAILKQAVELVEKSLTK